jgi:hypothetical protein
LEEKEEERTEYESPVWKTESGRANYCGQWYSKQREGKTKQMQTGRAVDRGHLYSKYIKG